MTTTAPWTPELAESQDAPTRYESILAEWEAELPDLQPAIFNALKQAGSEGRTRRELIFDVYGVHISEKDDLNNDGRDRKIRKTIEVMREKLIPIVSWSGSSGYRLEINDEGFEHMKREWLARIEAYQEKVRRLEQLRIRIRQMGAAAMPVALTRESEPAQMGLF